MLALISSIFFSAGEASFFRRHDVDAPRPQRAQIVLHGRVLGVAHSMPEAGARFRRFASPFRSSGQQEKWPLRLEAVNR